MPQKTTYLKDIGEILLVKRRKSKNLRLSILPDGRIRVGLPIWAPYAVGIDFARKRREWIIKHTSDIEHIVLKDGQRIGKSHRLVMCQKHTSTKTSASLRANSIVVRTPHLLTDSTVQAAAARACARALKQQTHSLLGTRLGERANEYGLAYKELRVKKLVSRWGSCSSDGVITLNYYLVQLPWHLIDYVLVHELSHTRHLDHSRSFWQLVDLILPDAELRKKQLKTYRPILLPE